MKGAAERTHGENCACFFIMTVTMIVDGVEHEVDLSEKQIEELLDTAKCRPYARVGIGETYYSLDNLGNIHEMKEEETRTDDNLYDAGNYWADEDTCESDVRADILLRKLRRFAMENGGYSSVDNEGLNKLWYIEPSESSIVKDLTINMRYIYRIGSVSFASWEAARNAMVLFRDDLIWYLYTYLPSKEMK